LAVARVESGFNPDAAARTTSASGLGQFIDRTGRAYGLNAENRFELGPGVKAFLKFLGETLKSARQQISSASPQDIYARSYGLYHDGPSLAHGGEEIARRNVLPMARVVSEWMKCGLNGTGALEHGR